MVCLVLLGIAGFSTQTLIFLTNSLAKPSLMMPLGYVGVFISIVADLWVFEVPLSLLTLAGIVLTSGGLLGGYLF